jgi:hypothetical protein
MAVVGGSSSSSNSKTTSDSACTSRSACAPVNPKFFSSAARPLRHASARSVCESSAFPVSARNLAGGAGACLGAARHEVADPLPKNGRGYLRAGRLVRLAGPTRASLAIG